MPTGAVATGGRATRVVRCQTGQNKKDGRDVAIHATPLPSIDAPHYETVRNDCQASIWNSRYSPCESVAGTGRRRLRRSSFAHPHENSGYLHALDPPQAHEEASNIWQLGSKIDNFTKTVYSVHTPLVFMIFVTISDFLAERH